MNNVFIVFENVDKSEGRGPMVVTKVFSKKEVADSYAFSIEPYQNKNEFTEVKEYKVFETYNVVSERLEELKNTPQVKEFLKLQKSL